LHQWIVCMFHVFLQFNNFCYVSYYYYYLHYVFNNFIYNFITSSTFSPTHSGRDKTAFRLRHYLQIEGKQTHILCEPKTLPTQELRNAYTMWTKDITHTGTEKRIYYVNQRHYPHRDWETHILCEPKTLPTQELRQYYKVVLLGNNVYCIHSTCFLTCCHSQPL
jgi:hypothetical protein